MIDRNENKTIQWWIYIHAQYVSFICVTTSDNDLDNIKRYDGV